MTVTKHSRGFSLIEVLIAMVLLAIMAMFLSRLMMSGIQLNHIANDETHLNQVAIDRMEQLERMSFTNLGMPCLNSASLCGSLDSDVTDSSVSPAVKYYDASEADYLIRWTVSLPTGDANLRRISVRAISNKFNAIGKQRELTIYIDREKY